MRKLEIKSPAKINLYLKVMKKREDGYHEISTLFEKISLFDFIILEKSSKKIEISSVGRRVPLDKENLAYKAIQLVSQKLGRNLGVRIKIYKNIPLGAGLGGGSSNAAAVLLGVNRLYELGIKKETLYEWGKTLGSDINFFLSEESFALGYGRGEKIKPLEIERKFWHLIIYPGFSVSTFEIYRAFDEFGLTKKIPDVKILVDCLYSKKNIRRELFYNSLEPIVLKKYPVIDFWRKRLISTPAIGILISGSGSSIFGLYQNRKEVEGIKKELEKFKRRGEFFVVSTDKKEVEGGSNRGKNTFEE